jgi:hypothetical protein
MHPTGSPIFPAPAASSTRRTAAGVKADRRSPEGLGLDAGEDRRTLQLAGATTPITCIMPPSARPWPMGGTLAPREWWPRGGVPRSFEQSRDRSMWGSTKPTGWCHDERAV